MVWLLHRSVTNLRLTGVWGVAAISALRQDSWGFGHGTRSAGGQWGDTVATCRYIETAIIRPHPSTICAVLTVLVCDI